MRGFMILCFAALAVAAPQGYNYQQGGGQFSSLGGGSGLLSSGGGSGILSSGGGSGIGYSGGSQGYQQQQQPVVTKHFYIHSAPEEHGGNVINKEVHVGTPRKNVNVVFVKSSANSAHRTILRVIPAVNEEKTVVYVLARNGGENEVVTQVAEAASQSHKPEVHFIKYNTNEEAENAQRSIQSQYDSLGGTSDVINEGVGQVTSVIGSLGGQGAGTGFGGSTGSGSTGLSGGHGIGAGAGFGSTSFGAGNGLGLGSGSGLTSFGAGTGLGGTAGHGIGLGGDAAGAAYLPPVKKQK